MRYIILAAGLGTRLHPLTLTQPKGLFSLEKDCSILQYTIDNIRKFEQNANITVVTGFMKKEIMSSLDKEINIVFNPFFNVTNSIASLWMAIETFWAENLTIINGDIVMEESLFKDIITQKFDVPMVLIDSSIKTGGDYGVHVKEDNIIIMSKKLDSPYGEYAGVSKINYDFFPQFKKQISILVDSGFYTEWYETALVQLIFNHSLELKFKDIKDYEWVEIDNVNDLLKAKNIYQRSLHID